MADKKKKVRSVKDTPRHKVGVVLHKTINILSLIQALPTESLCMIILL